MIWLLACTGGSVDLPDETEPIDSSVPEDTGCEETTYYMDVDGDGHGDENNPVESCEPITGAVIASGDCDDGDFEIGPDIEEECGDGFDNDCDGEIDEAAEGCEEEPDFVTLSFEDPLATILSDLPLAEIGGPFTSVADQDGDGVNDIALYIRSQSEFDERAYFFSGADLGGTTYMSESNHTFDAEGDYGSALFIPDRDEDGEMDLLISERWVYGSDDTYPPMHLSMSGDWDQREIELTTSSVGRPIGDWGAGHGMYWMAVGGDVDGDGSEELAIGDIYDRDAGVNTGAITIYFETWSWTAPVTKILGDYDSDYRVGANGAFGDFDGDGYDDLVIGGAPYGNGLGANRGAVCIEEGSRLMQHDESYEGLLFCNKILGDEDAPLDQYIIEPLPDLDGDGAQELAVTSEGGVYLFSGAEVTEGNWGTLTFLANEDPAIEPRDAGEGGPWSASLYRHPTLVQGATAEGSIDLAIAGSYTLPDEEVQKAVFLFDVESIWNGGAVRALDADRVWNSDEHITFMADFGDFDGDGRTDILVGTDDSNDSSGALTVLSP